MLSKDARCANRLRDLRQFIQLFCPGLDKTRSKFFRQSLWGILLSRSLVVARWAKWIPERCKRLFYRHKRLLNQLHSRDWDYQKVLKQYQQTWAQRLVEPDTPLIVDLTDLARPRAGKLKYLALVRDGSDSSNNSDHGARLVYGYWCIEIYACWGRGRITPLCLHPYSIEDPAVTSENDQILKQVEQVFVATQGRGVLVMDIGADRENLLIPWINQHRRFIVRLRGDRHLLLDNGVRLPALQLAEQLLAVESPDHRHAWCRVYLPECPQAPLYLVCKTIKGHERPLMTLTSLTAQNMDGAKRVLSGYRGRWSCEESVRFLKTQLGLERFALRVYESFAPLLLLAMLAMSFLSWLQLHFASMGKRLSQASPGRHEIKFLHYRLLEWFERQILAVQPRGTPP